MSIELGIERYSAMHRTDLADLSAFVAVPITLAFGRSPRGPTAFGHSTHQSESRLGLRPLSGTNYSASLTDAGSRSLERLQPAIELEGVLEG